MDKTTIAGIAASVLTGVSMIPQLVKIIKEKKADDISYGMLAVLFTGLCLWVYYGVLKNDLIIIIANGFSAVVNLCIAVMSFRYKNK
jgi:MtN3 and saliva related transmembrane protein